MLLKNIRIGLSNYLCDSLSIISSIRSYLENNDPKKTIELFKQITNPSEVVFNLCFNACASLGTSEALDLTKKTLEKMPKTFYSDSYILCSVLDALMKCGDVKYAESIYNSSTTKALPMYGAMMKGYIKNNCPGKAINLFKQIENPSEVNLIVFFNVCAQLRTQEALSLVKQTVKKMRKSYYLNSRLLTSLLDAFIKCGDSSSGEILFSKMKKSVENYGNLMSGFNKENNPEKTLDLFNKMKNDALSRIGDYSISESMIKQMPDSFCHDNQIQTALIDMWGKIGYMDKAKEIFEKNLQPDQTMHNSMIHGYGLNGKSVEAIQHYHRLPKDFIDEITNISVLNARSHSGLIDEACSIFQSIRNKTETIYSAMIDCFSRGSFFEEAQKLIDECEHSHPPSVSMYIRPKLKRFDVIQFELKAVFKIIDFEDRINNDDRCMTLVIANKINIKDNKTIKNYVKSILIVVALLSGARNEKNIHLSKIVYNRVKKIFPDEQNALIPAAVLLANRSYVQSIKKRVGLTWASANGQVFKFRAHDESHPRSNEIHAEAEKISEEIVKHGHIYDSSWITRPLNSDETIASVLCGHSERLAIAWCFLENPNFLFCVDRATKLIAAIRECEIIVRDASRIHHFYTNGQCSCNDYF
ncbi:unnamed protein product [Rotaria magnacalcarata]|uniref:DYW domain-containing protein n=1 Tax=Rotaria magnacalcarata TaxID=392030 RepID=A0A819WWR0_9BILA|nr:unnamed protein product [Rotaria magnacalcarata]